MSSDSSRHDYVLLSDEKEQLYAIPFERMHQFKIANDERAKEFIADNVTPSPCKIMGGFSQACVFKP
jgi:hypothetical protein